MLRVGLQGTTTSTYWFSKLVRLAVFLLIGSFTFIFPLLFQSISTCACSSIFMAAVI